MKRVLLISLMCLFTGGRIAMKAQSDDNTYQVIVLSASDDDDSTRQILKEDNPRPISRGIVQTPVYAYIYNKVVTLEFMETCSDVTVTVTNEDTGEVVYWESFSNPAEVNIDLIGSRNGNYRIEIAADDSCWEGEFHL